MSGTDGGKPRVAVVADPSDAQELTAVLEAVELPPAWTGDGGDDTLRRIQQDPPEVLVLSAHLERGDARALAAAVRRDLEADLGIVLVGEANGPVRNALDALDFDVDRFVGRPVAAKALRFAVRSAVPERKKLSALPPAGTDPGLDARLEAATNTAIDAFIEDAMDALPRAANAAASAPEPAPGDAAWDDDAAAPAPREPTLILPDGGVSAARQSGGAAPPHAVPTAAPEALTSKHAAHSDRTAPMPAPVFDAQGPEPTSDLGRELRAKMSAMAERLFPGRAGTPLSVGIEHDPHADIDLTAIGAETLSGASAESGPFPDLTDEETFADDGEADAGAPGSAGPDAGESRRGELAARTGAGTDEVTELREGSAATTRRRRVTGLEPARGVVGHREAEDVAALFARLHRGGFSGRLTLQRDDAEKTVCFEQGRPVFASSNLPHDRMGDLLYREGKITREQHAQSREVVAESGRRMGEILIEMGFLKRRELLPAVRRHIEDVIYSLFAWESGEYTAVHGDAASAEKIRLSRHPAALVMEGIRRKYGLDVLEARLGGDDAVVALRDAQSIDALVKELDLGPTERRVLESCGGERSVVEVARDTGTDLLGASQIAYGLIVLGAADAVGGALTAAGTGVHEGGRAPSLVGATDLAIDRQRVLAKYAHVGEADYFMLLGVRREASGFEIRRAYESARRDYAAEAFPDPVRRELAGEISEINGVLDEAFAVLSDDSLRERYKTNLQD